MKYIFLILSILYSSVLYPLVFSPSVAKADISWMKGVENCEAFAPALDAYLDKVDLSKYSLFPFWQKEELAIALREACSGKFAECNLETCKKWGSLSSFAPQQEGAREGTNATLFWLNRFLTCEQLMEQIKSRYSNLPEQELSDETKQKEFRLVLSAACSDRFSHCGFASCAEFNHAKVDKSQLANLSSSDSEKKSEKIAQNYEVLRANMIKLAKEDETEKGLVWRRFSNPEEAEVVARRREESRRRKVEESNSEVDSNGRSSSSFSFKRSYSSQKYSSRGYSSPKAHRSYSSSNKVMKTLPF